MVIVLMLCMHFQVLSYRGYIYYIILYGTDDVSMCTCMWCGDEYTNRVVFLICDRYYYVDC